MSVLSKVEHAVEDVVHVGKEAEAKASEVLVALVGSDQAHAFAQAAEQILKSNAGKLALDAVQVMETIVPALDSATKHAQAVSKLSSDLKTTENSLPASLLNLLVEIAVAAIKSQIVLP